MDDVVMPWAFVGGTRMALDHSLTHSLTHSILINLFIKVRLNTLPLPPLLSITFVPSAFYAYVWHILEGTSKAPFFLDTVQSPKNATISLLSYSSLRNWAVFIDSKPSGSARVWGYTVYWGI